MIFQIGQEINQYHVLSLLGKGGMGEVYLVEEALTDKKLALKTLYPHLTDDAHFRERCR